MFLLYAASAAAEAAAWVAMFPAITAEMITFSDCSRTSGDISAPIFPKASESSHLCN